jgi:G3E family GTPase
MSLVLNKEDIPTNDDLEQAATRLRHCAEILKTVKSKKYKDQDPDALRRIANFLEMLTKKDK